MGGTRLPSGHQTPSNWSNKAPKVSVSETFQKLPGRSEYGPEERPIKGV